MVNCSPASLNATFGALSDATRRGILARLAQGEAAVSELAAPCNMSLPAVSKHLRVLESAGLITRRKVGRVHRCRLLPAPMKGAADWIDSCRQFWEQKFDALAIYLQKQSEQEESPWQAHSPSPRQCARSGAPNGRRAKKSSRPGPNTST